MSSKLGVLVYIIEQTYDGLQGDYAAGYSYRAAGLRP
jgi:hypothetical protein